MKSKASSLYVLVGALFLTSIVSLAGYIMSSNRLNNVGFQRQIQSNYVQADKYNRMAKNLSVQKILDKIIDQNINVQTNLNNASNKIHEGIDIVYNKTKNEKDYQKLQSELPKLVGNELASKLLELDKPALNQSGKSTVTYDKADEILITFGRYDYKSTSVPIYIVVDYKSPMVNTANSIWDKDSKPAQYSGQDLFICSYDLARHKLGLSQYIKGDEINGQR